MADVIRNKRGAISHQLTNCITEPLFSSALTRAAFLDEYLARTGQPLGPLHGLPISVKDSFHVARVDSSIGIASLCFKPALENASLMQLLLDAGAVIHCKTNVPQTLMALDSVNNCLWPDAEPRESAPMDRRRLQRRRMRVSQDARQLVWDRHRRRW